MWGNNSNDRRSNGLASMAAVRTDSKALAGYTSSNPNKYNTARYQYIKTSFSTIWRYIYTDSYTCQSILNVEGMLWEAWMKVLQPLVALIIPKEAACKWASEGGLQLGAYTLAMAMEVVCSQLYIYTSVSFHIAANVSIQLNYFYMVGKAAPGVGEEMPPLRVPPSFQLGRG